MKKKAIYLLNLAAFAGISSFCAQGGISSSNTALPLDRSIEVEPPTLESGNERIIISYGEVEGAVSYRIYRALNDASENESLELLDPPGAITDTTTRRYEDTGLINGQEYIYELAAQNSEGEEGRSSKVSEIPLPTVPAVNALSGTGGDGQVGLEWDEIEQASYYKIYKFLTATSAELSLDELSPLDPPGEITSTSYTDTDVTNGTEYFYRVGAFQEVPRVLGGIPQSADDNPIIVKSRASDEISITPLPSAPEQVTGLFVTPGDQEVTLTWDRTSAEVSFYRIYRDGTALSAPVSQPPSGTQVTHTDSGLTNTQSYSYEIAAVIQVGGVEVPGTRSTSVNATPESPRVDAPDLNITAGDRQVALEWGPVTDAASYRIYRGTTGGSLELIVPAPGEGVFTNTSYTDTGLTNGTEYFYRVDALNTADVATESRVLRARPLPPAPVQVTGLFVTAGDQQVVLTWDRISTEVSFYRIYRDGTALSTTVSQPLSGTQVTHTDSGLTNAQPYSYEVAAVIQVGGVEVPGTKSSAANATPESPRVDAPDLNITAGDRQAALEWDPVRDAASYRIYRGTTGGSLELIVPAPGEGVFTNTSYTDTGLTNGTEYFYRVDALNAADVATESRELSARPLPPAPAQVTGLSVTAGDRQATLTWGRISTEVSFYRIYRDGIALSTTVSQPSSGTQVTHTDSGLTNTQSYSYEVAAVIQAGSVEVLGTRSSAVNATPNVLRVGAPNPSVTPDDRQVILTWPGVTDAASYRIYRGTTRDSLSLIDTTTELRYTDTGLTNGTEYFYRVDALNAADVATASGVLSARPLPPAPVQVTGLSVTAGDQQVVLTWNRISTEVSFYRIYRDGTALSTTVSQPSSGTQVTHTDSGLTNTQSYSYEVAAVIQAGSVEVLGTRSSAVNATPSAPIADAPNPGITAGDRQVTLTWPMATRAVSYRIHRGTTSGTLSPIDTTTELRYTDTGLTNGTTYYYRVDALNGDMVPTESRVLSARPLPPAPAQVMGLSATPGSRQVTLTWDRIVTEVSFYRIYRDGIALSATISQPASGTQVTHIDSGLTNAQSYSYEIEAVIQVGGVEVLGTRSSAVNATPSAPIAEAPNPTAAASNEQVILRWAAARNAVSYRIYRGTTSGVLSLLDPPGTTTELSYTDTGLTNGTTYYYRVDALNEDMLPTESRELSARPLPPAPAQVMGLSATPSIRQVTLTWDRITAGTTVSFYRVYRDGAAISTTVSQPASGMQVTYTDMGLNNNQRYSYYVVSLACLDGGSACTAEDTIEGTRSAVLEAVPREMCYTWRADGTDFCPQENCSAMNTIAGRNLCNNVGAEHSYRGEFGVAETHPKDETDVSLPVYFSDISTGDVMSYTFIEGTDAELTDTNRGGFIKKTGPELFFDPEYPAQTRESNYGAPFPTEDVHYVIARLTNGNIVEMRLNGSIVYDGDGTNCDPHFGGSLSNRVSTAITGSFSPVTLDSPSNKLRVEARLQGGGLQYRLTTLNDSGNRVGDFIQWSNLGIPHLADNGYVENNGTGLKVTQMVTGSCREIWSPKWGRKGNIQNYFNELTLFTQKGGSDNWSVEFRLYDEGLGFRYTMPPSYIETYFFNSCGTECGSDRRGQTAERTQFKLTTQGGDARGYHIKLGGHKYELKYNSNLPRNISSSDSILTPYTFFTKVGGQRYYGSIHEAAQIPIGFPAFQLKRSTANSSVTTFTIENAANNPQIEPEPTTAETSITDEYYGWGSNPHIRPSAVGALRSTPWRVVYVTKTPAELLETSLLLNLNMPFDDKLFRYRIPPGSPAGTLSDHDHAGELDLSWLKTGVYVAYWWTMHGTVSNGGVDRRGWAGCPTISTDDYDTAAAPGLERWQQITGCATTVDGKAYMDYGSELNAIGMLLEGWNKGSHVTRGWWKNWSEPWSWEAHNPFRGGNPPGSLAYDIWDIIRYGRNLDPPMEYILHLESRGNQNLFDSEIIDATNRGVGQTHGMNSLFHRWGGKTPETGTGGPFGIHYGKGGYVDGQAHSHYGGFYARHHKRTMVEGAKHKFAWFHHEGPKPTGEERTYPNMLSREAIFGMEQAGIRANGGGLPPGHPTAVSFTRMMGGPADYTPGAIVKSFTGNPPRSSTAGMTLRDTAARQLALMILLHSPITMFTETPYRARTHPNWNDTTNSSGVVTKVGIKSLVKKMTPMDWTEFRVLRAVPFSGSQAGDLVLARKQKGSGHWFIAGVSGGSTTSNSGGTASTYSLNVGDFMESGSTYTFLLIKDTGDGGSSSTTYRVNSRTYAHSELSNPISIRMGRFGGFIGVLEKN